MSYGMDGDEEAGFNIHLQGGATDAFVP